MIKKGQRFNDPSDPASGYEATRDITPGDYFKPDDVKPFGNAPAPREGEVVPLWLMTAARECFRG